MTVKAMSAERRELGPGERADRARRRRLVAAVAGLGVPSFVAGVAIGRRAKTTGFGDALFTPELSILLAAAYVVVLGIGAWLMSRNMDEHARSEQLWFSAYGAVAVIFAYPVWFLLWKGQLLPEPHHLALFLILYAGAILGYTVRKLNQNR